MSARARLSTDRKIVIGVVLLVATFLLLFVGGSAYVAWKLTTPPRRIVGAIPTPLPFAIEAVRFTTQDGLTLRGWYLPCPGATRAAVLVHGFALHRGYGLSRAELLRAHGYSVLVFDTRGCGESDAALVSFGWYETRDVLAAMDFLRSRGSKEFGLMGSSGGAAAIALAADRLRDVRWVILEASYPTVLTELDRDMRIYTGLPGSVAAALIAPFTGWRLGVSLDRLAPRETVGKFQCPVFIISGLLDRRVYIEDAQDLFDHARQPKQFWLVPHAGHADFHKLTGKEYERRVLEFIDGAMK